MVDQLFADRKVMLKPRPDAASEQDARRAVGSGRDHDHVSLERSSGGQYAAAIRLDPVDERICANREVRPGAGPVEIRKGSVPAKGSAGVHRMRAAAEPGRHGGVDPGSVPR
jgi:hypothetical protein